MVVHDNFMHVGKDDFSIMSYIYSLYIIFWTTLFSIFWNRKESSLALEWGSYGKALKIADMHKNFKGVVNINLVSGLPEITYSKKKRYFFYFISFLETAPILAFTLFLKVIFLNLKGYVDKNQILYNHKIFTFPKENYYFSKIPLGSIFLDILLVITTTNLNSFYSSVCLNSTLRENHRTNESFYNAIIIKRFEIIL